VPEGTESRRLRGPSAPSFSASQPSSAALRTCLIRPAGVRPALAKRISGTDYVVYNPLSGSTHFFDELTGQLLVAILTGTVTQEQLSTLAGSALGIPDSDYPLEDLRERLSILFDLGLIEPAEPC